MVIIDNHLADIWIWREESSGFSQYGEVFIT